MNGKQHAVMWLGLLLITLRMFTSVQWTELKAVFQSGSSSSSGNSNPGSAIQNPLTPGGLLHDLNPLSTGLNPFHAVIIGGQTFIKDLTTGQLFPASSFHPPKTASLPHNVMR